MTETPSSADGLRYHVVVFVPTPTPLASLRLPEETASGGGALRGPLRWFNERAGRWDARRGISIGRLRLDLGAPPPPPRGAFLGRAQVMAASHHVATAVFGFAIKSFLMPLWLRFGWVGPYWFGPLYCFGFCYHKEENKSKLKLKLKSV